MELKHKTECTASIFKVYLTKMLESLSDNSYRKKENKSKNDNNYIAKQNNQFINQ